MKSIIKFYVIGASENICKWILINFSKNYVLKKGKILMFFGKEIKRKAAIRMHHSQAEIVISPKITSQPEFFLWSPFSLVLLKDFLKICFEKRENIDVFWKGNKTKGDNKDAL